MPTYLTTQDVLNLTLAVGFGSIAVFLCVLLLRLSKTVAIFNEIAEKVKSITEAVDQYLWQPLHFLQEIFRKIREKKGK